MVTVPHIMVGLERMLDYRGVGLARFHCITYVHTYLMCVTYPLDVENLDDPVFQYCTHTKWQSFDSIGYIKVLTPQTCRVHPVTCVCIRECVLCGNVHT